MSDSLDFEILQRPDFAALKVNLDGGQQIMAEPSAMVGMDPNIHMKTSMKGGLWKGIKRGLGGESFFMNTFTAEDGPGEILFAPGPMGDLNHVRLEGACDLMIQRGGYVAHGGDIDMDSNWQGLGRGFFGEGMFLMKASGTGDVFFNTYGAMLEVDVNGGYVVDNTYVVAFESTLDYRVSTITPKDGGLFKKAKSFLFGGEMFVSRFSGQGKLWVQTRSVAAFTRWVHPFRPVQNNN